MPSHEINRYVHTERFISENIALTLNRAHDISSEFIDPKSHEKIQLELGTALVLPPPVKALSFEIGPRPVQGQLTEENRGGMLSTVITLPHSHDDIRESIILQLVANLKTQSQDVSLAKTEVSQVPGSPLAYTLAIDENPELHIMSWQNGIRISAFAGETLIESNQSFHDFFTVAVSALDTLNRTYPQENSDDFVFDIDIRMPENDPMLYNGSNETSDTETRPDIVDAEIVELSPRLPQHEYGGFDEVGGLFHAKERLRDMGLAWQFPELAKEYEIDISHFVLAGPPGTGKTTLINAFANEFHAIVMNVKSSEIINAYLGKSSENLSAKFTEALKYAAENKVILLFDEIDSLIAKNVTLHKEYVQTINTFKQEMDALKHLPHAQNLIVAGATNCDVDDLNEAIIRSGRLEVIAAPAPSEIERVDIWGKLVYSTAEIDIEFEAFNSAFTSTPVSSKFANGVSPEELAKITDGMTGADFKEIITKINRDKFRQAAGLAALRMTKNEIVQLQPRQITQAELEEAIRRFGIK